MKFRKKPVVIEAEQWHLGDKMPGVVPVWITYDGMVIGEYNPAVNPRTPCNLGFGIKTLEGWRVVTDGDWIISGVNGDRHPCKPDIFEKTFEPVEG